MIMESDKRQFFSHRMIHRYQDGNWSRVEDRVTPERPLHIEINGKEFITLLCTPVQRKELTAGFLFSEGFVQTPEQIGRLDLREEEDRIDVELRGIDFNLEERIRRITLTSGCGRGTILCDVMDALNLDRVSGTTLFPPGQILDRMSELHHRSSTYLATGGTHSAAVTDGASLLAFAEDIGRHNAVDKVLGSCFLQGIPPGDKVVLASGRISSEIIMKVGRSRFPILATRAAATDQVIRIAETLQITLIGFARGKRMNIYTCPERVLPDLPPQEKKL
jgi:FdhD protein